MPRRALLLSLLALAIPAGAAGATGDLTQLADPFGCNYWGTGGGVCTPTTALHQPEAIALSPDGKSVYVAVSQSEAVVQFQRDPATGAIDQPSDPTGCVSDTGSGPCVDGERLQFPDGVAVSPDGKNVYVAASNSGAVAIMDRDPTTGLLTQRTAGPLGCVTADGSSGECATAAGLVAPDDVEVSPDGKGVYVVGGNTLVTLNRDPTTGDLSANGCVDETAVAPCADGRAIYDVRGVAISPDSKTVVTTSAGSSGVYDAGMAVFDRDPATNVLTQRSNLEGCFTSGGSGGTCTDARDVDVAFDAAFSADGKNVYVPTRIGAIAIFDRAPATGLITQKAGIDGCITDSSFDATSQTCTLGHSLPYLTGAVVSPDGMSVYASSQDLGGVAIFDRDPSNGRLVQRASPAGCVASAAAYQAQCAPVKQMLTAWDIGIDPLSRNVYVAAHSDRIGVLAREGGGAAPTSIPTATPSPGATPSPTVTATPTPTRLPPTLPPSRILRIIVNNRNGNLTVSAQVPGPGRIVVQADGSYRVVERAAAAKTRKLRIAKAAKTVSRASKISLVLKPKGKAKTMLHRTGKLKATLRQTFTPANGTKGSVVTKKVTFKYARKTG